MGISELCEYLVWRYEDRYMGEVGMNVGVCWIELVRCGFYLNRGKRTGFVEVSC